MAQAVDRAYAMVRDGIVRGTYAAALRITEQEIAQALGISRTPVREALRRLQAEGFLKVLPNVGAVVTPWTDSDTRNVFELRALLEPYGAQRAAQNITPEGIAELRRLADEQYQESVTRSDGYVDRIGSLNSRFHQCLQEYSGNARLVTLLPALLEAPMMLKTFGRYRPEHLIRSAAHHLELVTALEACDGEWAASVMRSHILAAHAALRAAAAE
ncbi:MAG: GntR family transcriptional regulator [Steroidobacteraceae bacterium]|jgi:DNA-binding GntR family transcriptional regulator|nr:GntR family transcriptional regulator [Steroidobacteraceae bacterium]